MFGFFLNTMIKAPNTKILFNKPKNFKPFIERPYKMIETNSFVEQAKSLGEEKFQNLLVSSLSKKHINKGDVNYIYQLEGFEGWLLRVNEFYTEGLALTSAFIDNLFLTPLTKNPNHISAKVGFVEIMKEIPGLSIKDAKYIETLKKLPQKSFDEFAQKIVQNAKDGFYHDGRGANTLVDEPTKIIESIDSFTSQNMTYKFAGKIKLFLSSFFGNDYQLFAQDTDSQILKKALKAIANNKEIVFTNNEITKLYKELQSKNKREIIDLFYKINQLKLKLTTSPNKLSKKLEPKTKKLNKIIDRAKLNIFGDECFFS